MKKIIIAISCVIVLSAVGCKEKKTPPETIKNTLTEMYPGISKIKWENEKGGIWEAEFKNNGIKTSVAFNANGSLKEVEEEIALNNFPKAAQEYIQKNYPDKKIKDITKMTDAKGLVTFEAEVNEQDLIFDALGNFIKIEKESKDGEETNSTSTPNQEAPSQKVDVKLIPQTVHDFIAKNYPGYSIENAEHDPMCNGDDAIDVSIKKNGSPAYSVIFSPKWEFIQQEEDVDLSTAPQKLKDVLKTQFADYTANSQIEKLTLADKKLQYAVDLTKNGIKKEAIFDADGKVNCSH